MKNKDLPPICGFEFEINKLVNKERDSRQFEEKSRLENVNSGFACALHMHQPTIPAGAVSYTHLTLPTKRIV